MRVGGVFFRATHDEWSFFSKHFLPRTEVPTFGKPMKKTDPTGTLGKTNNYADRPPEVRVERVGGYGELPRKRPRRRELRGIARCRRPCPNAGQVTPSVQVDSIVRRANKNVRLMNKTRLPKRGSLALGNQLLKHVPVVSHDGDVQSASNHVPASRLLLRSLEGPVLGFVEGSISIRLTEFVPVRKRSRISTRLNHSNHT